MNDQIILTTAGKEKILAELAELKGVKRLEIARRLKSAIEMGDLSENADYSAAKEDQAFIEGRIQELNMILKDVIIIDDRHRNSGLVEIGSTVTIQEDHEPKETFQIVGPQEADPRQERISYDSPIGQALLGHREGDTVKANTPGGELRFTILKIT